jgi:hypothetical protein
MSVAIGAGQELRPGVPHALVSFPPGAGPVAWTKDGERFLASMPIEETHPELQVIFNWTRLLKR